MRRLACLALLPLSLAFAARADDASEKDQLCQAIGDTSKAALQPRDRLHFQKNCVCFESKCADVRSAEGKRLRKVSDCWDGVTAVTPEPYKGIEAAGESGTIGEWLRLNPMKPEDREAFLRALREWRAQRDERKACRENPDPAPIISRVREMQARAKAAEGEVAGGPGK